MTNHVLRSRWVHRDGQQVPKVRQQVEGHRDAAATFRDQLAAYPRAAVEPGDIAALADVGYGDLLPVISMARDSGRA